MVATVGHRPSPVERAGSFAPLVVIIVLAVIVAVALILLLRAARNRGR